MHVSESGETVLDGLRVVQPCAIGRLPFVWTARPVLSTWVSSESSYRLPVLLVPPRHRIVGKLASMVLRVIVPLASPALHYPIHTHTCTSVLAYMQTRTEVPMYPRTHTVMLVINESSCASLFFANTGVSNSPPTAELRSWPRCAIAPSRCCAPLVLYTEELLKSAVVADNYSLDCDRKHGHL